MTITYTPIGYGVTDENGVAKLDTDMNGDALTHSYTGTGAGELDIVASFDSTIGETSILSNEIEILDCIVMDYKADGTKNTNFVANANATVTTNDTTKETTISATANAIYRQTSLLTGDFEATLQAKTNNTVVRVGFTDNSSKYSRVQFTTNDEYQFIKIKRVGSTWTAQKSTDGTTWTTFNSTETSSTPLADTDCYFYISIAVPSGGERSLTYKNLKIFPI